MESYDQRKVPLLLLYDQYFSFRYECLPSTKQRLMHEEEQEQNHDDDFNTQNDDGKCSFVLFNVTCKKQKLYLCIMQNL